MCGIVGCLALALEADPDQDWVHAATERITHRGPDDEGFYTDADVALGYKRLAIIDLSEGGHQPMRSADGRYWMVYNGEIYNYVELGQELREAGVELRSSSDSEVLLETYARVGKDIVHRLRGMFAFAIWDTWTRELFCARDQFGIKPFYYRLDRGPVPPQLPQTAQIPQTAQVPGAAQVPGPAQFPGAGQPPSGQPPASAQFPLAQPPPQQFPGAGQPPSGQPPASAQFPPAQPPPHQFPASGRPQARPGGRHAAPRGAGGADVPGSAEGLAGSAEGLAGTGDTGSGVGASGGSDALAGTAGPGGAGGPVSADGAGDGQEETAVWDDWFIPGPSPDPSPDPSAGPSSGPSSGTAAGSPGRLRGRHASPAATDALPAVTGDGTGYPAGVGDPTVAGGWPSPVAVTGPIGQAGVGQAGVSQAGLTGSMGQAGLTGSMGQAGLTGPVGPAAMARGLSVPDGAGAEDRMLRFASERKALAEPGELRALDGAGLRRYLSFQYVPPPGTMTPPVQVLPPGHAMIARPGSPPDVYRYWRAELRPAPTPGDTTARTILEVMRDSVAVHLRSDAPLGAFLSGGIDSAAICALAAEQRPDLLTFTVGFEREGYSEIEAAQETAAALGVSSHPYVITAGEFFHYLPQIVWHLDDPMADAAAIPLWFVAREASRHVKVVLSGEGSDELFGGYAIYHQPGLVRAAERLPEWGRLPLQRAASLLPAGVRGKGLLERTSTPLRRRYIGNAHVYSGSLLETLARPRVGSPYSVTDPIYDQADESGLDDVACMQLVDINTWLPGDILVKADRMTMAHSLELRVPFLDREVMAVAARLAREEKVGAGTTKIALRDAMSEVLPDAAARRAKLGFPVPIGHWLRGEAHDFAQQVLRSAQTGEWVDRQAALALLERFRGGDPQVTWRHVWLLIVFSLWHQIFVEHVYDPVALGWERAAGVAR